jgi:hypothetical protein
MTPVKTHPWPLGVLILAACTILPARGALLHASGSPNLTPTLTPTNWFLPGVPRNAGDAGPSVTLTTMLDGNSATTWLNWSTFQESPGTLPPWSSLALIDGGDVNVLFDADGSTSGFHSELNRGPYTVRGGRHTLTIIADPDQNVAETNETDNTWSRQFIWSPLELLEDAPDQRAVPPDPGTLALPNADGFVANRYPVNAWAIGLAPLGIGDDYDLHVYDDYASDASGFSVLRQSSTWGPGSTEFVVGHFFQTPYTLYPAAVRVQSSEAADFVIEHDGARNREGGATQSFLSQTLHAGEVMDVFEAELVTGTSYFFSLQTLGGPADLEFEIFPGSFGGTYARGDGLQSWSYDASTRLQVYAPAVSGWHPVVVYRPTGTNIDMPVNYTLHWQNNSYVDVEGGPTPGPELSLAAPVPNPMRGPTRLAGTHSAEWNGRSERGERLEAGVYIIRLQAEGRSLTQRVALLP